MVRRASAELVFLPLGGVGEIGMNLALYGYGTPGSFTWLMVDCGLTFGDARTTPGVDLVFPDIRFIEEERRNLAGIVITHAHEDHYGALIDLWPRLGAPVYATAFTAGLLAAKADEGDRRGGPVPVNVVEQGARLEIGPFAVEYVPVSHSIPESNALIITTPLGTVVHSGDWKIDATPGLGKAIDVDRFHSLGESGVRALICDSTNAMRAGRSPSEADVAARLAEIVAKARNRVAVTIFSSNVARIRAVAEAARAAGRHVVAMGRAMRRVIDVASELGYLDDLPPFLTEDDFGQLQRSKVVLLCTGSQGEERAALARIANDDHPRVSLSPGDLVVFSSRTIPGNETAVNAIINGLASQAIEVMTDADGLVHVSGHPRRDELAEMYRWLRPQLLVPVHGESMHLAAHAELARACGIAEVVIGADGKMIRLAPPPAEVVDEVVVDPFYRDGALIVAAEESGVPERRRLAFSGCVVATVVLDGRFELLDDPRVVTFGIPAGDATGTAFEPLIEDAIVEAVESIPRPRRRDPDLVAQAARRAIRALLAQKWGKKPLCKVLVDMTD